MLPLDSTTVPHGMVPLMKNPLTELREDLGHSASSWAKLNHVNVSAIQLSDLGCYTKPLPLYSPYLSAQDYKDYQLFRTHSRRRNFPEPPPVLPLPELLEYLELSSYKLAVKLCIQPADTFRLLKQKRTNIPQELITALQDIGWSYDDVKSFARDHILLVLKPSHKP